MVTTTRSSTTNMEEDAAPPASEAEPGSKHKLPDDDKGEDEVESHEHDTKRTKSSGDKYAYTIHYIHYKPANV